MNTAGEFGSGLGISPLAVLLMKGVCVHTSFCTVLPYEIRPQSVTGKQ